jgi:hypothetical protein
MKKSESKIQQECVVWFRNNFLNTNYLMFSVPNEGRSAREQMFKKATGLMAGVSDTIIDTGKQLIYCEFKDAKGVQSPKQKEFQSHVESLGRSYWVIRSLDEFIHHLTVHQVI